MRDYPKRLAFGSERQLRQPDGEQCDECGCVTGSLHHAGCAGEECPVCAKAVIGCCCEALSPYDGEKIIQGVYNQFRDLASAIKAAGEESCPHGGGSSYLQHAVMRFIFNNVPEDARAELTQAFHLRFPGLVPQLQDEDGRNYYTAEQLSEALDIPVSEVNERIEAMVSAGKTIHFGEGKKLRKVH